MLKKKEPPKSSEQNSQDLSPWRQEVKDSLNQRRPLKSQKQIAEYQEDLLNAARAGDISRQDVNTQFYGTAVLSQTLREMRVESDPNNQLAEELRKGHVLANLSREEKIQLLTMATLDHQRRFIEQKRKEGKITIDIVATEISIDKPLELVNDSPEDLTELFAEDKPNGQET